GGEARSVALLLTLGRGSGHLAHALDGGLRSFGRLFRRLVRGSRLAIGAATRTARTGTAGAAGRAPRAAVFPVGRGHRFLVGTERGLVAAQRVALVDPHLHADDAVCGERLRGAVVDVGTQRVQRHAPLAIPLAARDLGAVEAARAHDLDALGTEAHRVLHRALHRAAEHDPLLQLLRDRIGDQLRVDLGLADLLDVDVHR